MRMDGGRLGVDKTIRRVTDIEEQDAENYRYWQGLSIGERIIAISEMSAAAYAAEGVEDGHDAGSARVLVRVERP